MKKIMVVIPLRPYKVWVARCEPQSPQYRHLTNGIIGAQTVKKKSRFSVTRSGPGIFSTTLPAFAPK